MVDPLHQFMRWLHPDFTNRDEHFDADLDAQAVTGIKLLGAMLLVLAAASQLLLHFLYQADTAKTVAGLEISYHFLGLGALLLLALKAPFLRRIARGLLVTVIFFLLADTLILQLRLFPIHKAQLGIFMSSLCFIAFTFLPYRPWVIGAFGIFGLSVILGMAAALGLDLNPHTDTSLFWLMAEFSSLTVAALFFRGAILNMQLRLRAVQEDIEDIKSIRAGSEGQRVEFKSSFRYDYRQNQANVDITATVMRTIAGFLNSGGGSLMLGVDDEGRPIGLEKDYLTLKKRTADGYELAIVQAVSDVLGAETCQNLRFKFLEMDGREICVIHIRPASKPVYVESKNQSVFYIRTGNSTQSLDTKRGVEYIQNHWKNRPAAPRS